jgi:thiol reductant ABC exporter CydD subunit
VNTTSTTGTARTTVPFDSQPVGPAPPRLVDPGLAARVPGLQRAAAVALAIGVATAVVVVVQAIALATAVERSLLHHAPLQDVLGYVVVVGIAVLVRATLAGAGDLFASGTAERVVTGLRGELLTHALALGPGWLAGERAGELSLTATRGLRSLHAYLARYLPQAAAAAVVPVMLLAWVATQDWLSLVVVVALVAAVPVTMIYFGREATRRSQRQWRRLGSLAARFLQLVEGLPTLRSFGREGQGRREVEAATEGVRTATMRTLRVAFVSALAMDMIAGFGVGLVAMVLGLRLLWGQLGLQTAMAVLLVAPEIFIPLRRAGAEFHASTEGQAAVARVLDVLNTPVPAATPTNVAAADRSEGAPPSKADGRTASAPASTLRVARLRVDYPHRDRPALASCSFELDAGARLALTGPSGAGKSTLLAALLRFVDPVTGEMFCGGRPSTALSPREWRAQFSWLPQRPHLFHANLAENLRIGAPHAVEDDLYRVLAAVGLHALVATLPNGLATVVGHDGLTLSAGERQRVALARALLCPAPILLLDEPTASLDSPTVAHLAPAIEPWLNGRSVVVAAHDPVLLARFDAVHTLEAPASLPMVASP